MFSDHQGSLTTKEADQGFATTLEAHSGDICQI